MERIVDRRRVSLGTLLGHSCRDQGHDVKWRTSSAGQVSSFMTVPRCFCFVIGYKDNAGQLLIPRAWIKQGEDVKSSKTKAERLTWLPDGRDGLLSDHHTCPSGTLESWHTPFEMPQKKAHIAVCMRGYHISDVPEKPSYMLAHRSLPT